MWNEAVHRGTIANVRTIHVHEDENENAVAVRRMAVRDACEVKVPLQPHSSKDGPVAAASAAWDACLTLDSLLQHNTINY